jgi:hypothetical protein
VLMCAWRGAAAAASSALLGLAHILLCSVAVVYSVVTVVPQPALSRQAVVLCSSCSVNNQ